MSMSMSLAVASSDSLPATSNTVRVTDWFSPSVANTTSAGQPDARPDRLSSHVKLTVTGEVCQPDATLDAEMVGAVAS